MGRHFNQYIEDADRYEPSRAAMYARSLTRICSRTPAEKEMAKAAKLHRSQTFSSCAAVQRRVTEGNMEQTTMAGTLTLRDGSQTPGCAHTVST